MSVREHQNILLSSLGSIRERLGGREMPIYVVLIKASSKVLLVMRNTHKYTSQA